MRILMARRLLLHGNRDWEAAEQALSDGEAIANASDFRCHVSRRTVASIEMPVELAIGFPTSLHFGSIVCTTAFRLAAWVSRPDGAPIERSFAAASAMRTSICNTIGGIIRRLSRPCIDKRGFCSEEPTRTRHSEPFCLAFRPAVARG
jgi:hypothetical protein